MTVAYYSKTLFIISLLFLIIPHVVFIIKIYNLNSLPWGIFNYFPGYNCIYSKLSRRNLNGDNSIKKSHDNDDSIFWFSYDNDKDLTYFNNKIYEIGELNSLPKLILFLIFAIILLIFQLIYIVIYIIWVIVIALPLTIIWLLLGSYFYQTKILAIGSVWNFWFTKWSGTNNFNITCDISIELLNESIFYEFVLESMPQLLLQCLNNEFNMKWNFITYLSIFFSISMTANGIYRYLYYMLYKGIHSFYYQNFFQIYYQNFFLLIYF